MGVPTPSFKGGVLGCFPKRGFPHHPQKFSEKGFWGDNSHRFWESFLEKKLKFFGGYFHKRVDFGGTPWGKS